MIKIGFDITFIFFLNFPKKFEISGKVEKARKNQNKPLIIRKNYFLCKIKKNNRSKIILQAHDNI